VRICELVLVAFILFVVAGGEAGLARVIITLHYVLRDNPCPLPDRMGQIFKIAQWESGEFESSRRVVL